jgi:twitching motility protein PilT
MTVNGRIRQCIANAELTSGIAENIRDGAYYGMQSFDQSLAKLFEERKISLEETLENASNSHDLRLLLERQGLVRTGEGKMTPPSAAEVSGKVDSDLVETARSDVGALRL